MSRAGFGRAALAVAVAFATVAASAVASYVALHGGVAASTMRHLATPPVTTSATTYSSDLRDLLLPVPAGAILAAPDQTFSLATVPTDLVWQSLRNRGFLRGAVRRWRQANRTEVAVVLFQFATADQARDFTDAAHAALQYWPGCGGFYTTGSESHSRIYGCEAIGTDEPPGCRATVYGNEFSGYLVARQPTGVDPRSVSELMAAQGDLLG